MACVIAAPCSGSGKTLLSLCLAALARQRGVSLQPFKVGPDYLDPQLLAAVAGRPCRNLDTLLCGAEWVQRCFQWHGSRADRVLVEGVMGLFDGRGPSPEGSTAEVASLLQLPVVLVVEASRQAGSLAALVRGFRDHGPPAVALAGVVLNRVGSERHRALLAEALAAIAVPLLGVLPQHPSLVLPSRHLGLLPPGELADLAGRVDLWAALAAEHLDLERLWPLLAPPRLEAGTPDPIRWCLERHRQASGMGGARLLLDAAPPSVSARSGQEPAASGAGAWRQGPAPAAASRQGERSPQPWSPETVPQAAVPQATVPMAVARPSGLIAAGAVPGAARGVAVDPAGGGAPLIVAIAADQAFHFRYPEATELLEAVGLQPLFWSPLADQPLPPGCRAVLLPGGYPELHAAQLAASRRSLAALAQAAAAGVPIVAECGGLLLLGHSLHDGDDRPQPMAGVLPFTARRGALTLGYRQAEACVDGLLVRRGERLVGHEFHRWQLQPLPEAAAAPAVAPWCGAAQPLSAPHGDAADAAIREASAAAMAVRPGLWQLEGWGWTPRPEGWTNTRLHATWLHLHWAGCPAIPWRLAAAAASVGPRPVSGASCSPPIPAPPG
ncbi:MAG: cobyrinate a,c-diamide synthase [Cyanobium sp.]